jgi:hypothetical protein
MPVPTDNDQIDTERAIFATPFRSTSRVVRMAKKPPATGTEYRLLWKQYIMHTEYITKYFSWINEYVISLSEQETQVNLAVLLTSKLCQLNVLNIIYLC